MRGRTGSIAVLILGLLLASACAPQQSPAPTSGGQPAPCARQALPTLVFVHGGEVQSFAHKEILPTGRGNQHPLGGGEAAVERAACPIG